MVKTPANPLGLPKQVFDDFQAQLAANRSQFYRRGGSLLWLQPTRRKSVGGRHRELVEARDDGRREGALRRHRRFLAPILPTT